MFRIESFHERREVKKIKAFTHGEQKQFQWYLASC